MNPLAGMAAAGTPRPGVPDCVTRVALSLSCQNLIDMDVLSKSDPQCVFYMSTPGTSWVEVSVIVFTLDYPQLGVLF